MKSVREFEAFREIERGLKGKSFAELKKISKKLSSLQAKVLKKMVRAMPVALIFFEVVSASL